MFPQEVRDIFQYEHQGQILHADPVRVLRVLSIATGGRLSQLIEEARAIGSNPTDAGTPEYAAGQIALGILADATLQAFGLAAFDPYTGEGTLEDEALDLLAKFTHWQNKKKASGGTSPSPPP